MEEIHRKKLDQLCEELILYIDMNILWPLLLKNKIYNRDDCNIPIWKKNLNDLDTVRDIFLTIKTRGPDAYKNLLKSLREAEYDVLAIVLENYQIIEDNINK
ncbi:uncharacterized protein LOC127278982 [Leptopilina boulardi]|uniref:uncharacterized protein LOC127278982 n=1 Tax=Leptopilina boulardi TaxID=63433 RepID=UPI0021F61492|nr:uncharacterized protein LOC127278982 [Leptopilina boulardi]